MYVSLNFSRSFNLTICLSSYLSVSHSLYQFLTRSMCLSLYLYLFPSLTESTLFPLNHFTAILITGTHLVPKSLHIAITFSFCRKRIPELTFTNEMLAIYHMWFSVHVFYFGVTSSPLIFCSASFSLLLRWRFPAMSLETKYLYVLLRQNFA